MRCATLEGGRMTGDIQRSIKCDFATQLCHLGGNGITTRSVEKKNIFEPPIQQKCANKSRGDMLTQVLFADLLPASGFIISNRARGL